MHLTLWLVSDCKYCIKFYSWDEIQECETDKHVAERRRWEKRMNILVGETKRKKQTWKIHKWVRRLYQCELKTQLTACGLGSFDQNVSPVARAYAHCEDHSGSVRCGNFMVTCAINSFSSTDLLNCVRNTKHFFVICKKFMFDWLIFKS